MPGLLLQTCHRVELYTAGAWEAPELGADLPDGVEVMVGDEVVRHAIAVAVGLDSVMLGEDQILHQLRTATAEARRAGGFDPVLDRLMSVALRAGRQARSWRSGPRPSLADAAIAAAERRVGSVSGRRVLVVGTGEMGRLTVDVAKARGAVVTVASRTIDRAMAVARSAGIEFLQLDPGPALRDMTAIVVALRGSWGLAPGTVEHLLASTAVVVDLSVPAALSEPAAIALGARFVSVDDLAGEPRFLDEPADVARLHALVEATLLEFRNWLDGGDRRAAARLLAEQAETERLVAIDQLWRNLPSLEPEARIAIERMSRHLTRRLLREPLERLGRDSDDRIERAARELFDL